MKHSSKEHSDLLDLTFSTALNEELWPEVLDRLMRNFHALHAVLLSHQNGGKKGKVFHTRLKDPHWRIVFEDLYKGCIPFLYEARHLLTPGAVMKGDRLLPYGKFEKTDFYRDFMRPQNLHHILAAILESQGGTVSTLSLLRSKKAGAFKEADILALKALTPCLQKALRVNGQIARAGLDDIISQEVLDILPLGVMIMSAKGKVLAMNRRAEALLGERDGLSIGPEGLKALRPGDSASIQKGLAEALGMPVEKGEKRAILLIPRPSGRPFYSLIFIPAKSCPEFSNGGSVGCVVLISSLEGGGVVSRDILKSLFRLTEAESHFAAQLMLGLSVEKSSRNLRLSVQTGRTYVKRIFAKTGVRRQGELVHLLIESPARLLLGRLGKP